LRAARGGMAVWWLTLLWAWASFTPVGTLAYQTLKAYYVGKRTVPHGRRNMPNRPAAVCGASSYGAFDVIAVAALGGPQLKNLENLTS
jgi:hypothetical protein